MVKTATEADSRTNGQMKRSKRRSPIDWDAAIPEIEILFAPYLYVAHRTWIWGPTESGKSLWVQWVCAQLSNDGKKIVYIQQENSLPVEMLRWHRLGADLENVAVYHDQGFDLADWDDVDELVAIAQGSDLVVLDTLTSCWSGNEDSNFEIGAFDRNVMVRLKDDVGCGVVVIHHAGHGRHRQPASMGRGASSQGQKADTILEIKTDQRFSQGTFNIIHGKNRPGGGIKEPDQRMQVVDLDDAGRIVKLKRSDDGRSWMFNGKKVDLADYALDIIPDERSLQGRLTKKQEAARVVITRFLEKQKSEGASQSEIGEKVDVSTKVVYSVLSAMSADGDLAPRKPRGNYVLAQFDEGGD